MRDSAAELRKNRKGRLHEGVVGAHGDRGGTPTPQADLDADEHRFGEDAHFTMGPDGRDSMYAGPTPLLSSHQHADTEPYLRRPASQGDQLPLDTDGSMQPNDPVQHFVRLKHPHLAQDYSFEKSGGETFAHTVDVYHHPDGNRVGNNHSSLNATPAQHVGFLRWTGKHGTSDTAPGEIEGVAVHPEHQGKGLSTALWDYAQAHTALNQTQGPVHSKDRSTAGNHWAHFVGGAAMARTEGHENATYFENHQWGMR